MLRIPLAALVAVAVTAGARAQNPPSVVSILERMDRRMDDVSTKLVKDMQDLKSVQKEMLAELARLEKVEQHVKSLEARVAALESRPASGAPMTDPDRLRPAATPVSMAVRTKLEEPALNVAPRMSDGPPPEPWQPMAVPMVIMVPVCGPPPGYYPPPPPVFYPAPPVTMVRRR